MDIALVGLKLKELREQAGLTQAQLAERADVAQRTISHIEQGRNKPTFETITKLAEALDVDCREFLKPPISKELPPRGRPKSP